MVMSPARLRAVIRGVLVAFDGPANMRQLEWHVHGYGHWDVDTFDVRDAVAWLVDHGEVELTARNEFLLKDKP